MEAQRIHNGIWSRARILGPALVLLAALTRLWNLEGPSLWMDEAFSHLFAALPMETAWLAMITDAVHPPLYYLLLRPWLDLAGGTEFALRFPSAVVGVLTVALVIRAGREWLGRRAAGWAGLLLAVNPFHVWYSQEARMYALLAALALAVLTIFWRALRLGRSWTWAALAVVSASAYLTHYFALFLPLIQFLYLIATFRRHYSALVLWTMAQAAAAVPLATWLIALYSTGGGTFGIGWIPCPSPTDLLKTFWAFVLAYDGQVTPLVAIGTVSSAALLAFSAWGAAKERGARGLLLLSAALPPLATFFLSLRRPAYVNRFFIGSLPPVMLLIGAGLAYAPRLWRWAAAVTLIGMSTWGIIRFHSDPLFARENWREAASYVETRESAGDVLVMFAFQYRVPFDYYYEGDLEITAVTLNRTTTPLAEIASGHSRLWLIFRGRHEDAHHLALSEPFDLERETAEDSVSNWLHARKPSSSAEFPGVLVMLFDLDRSP